MNTSAMPLVDASLHQRLEALEVQRTHVSVAKCLSEIIENAKFQLAFADTRGLIYRDGRILDDAGAQIAPAGKEWIEQQVLDAGEGWRRRVQELSQEKWVRTSFRIVPLYFVARMGEHPTDFLQAVVNCETEYPAEERDMRDLVDHYMRSPEDMRQISHAQAPNESQPAIGAARYRFWQLEHMPEFLARDTQIRRERYPGILKAASERRVNVADMGTGDQFETSWAEAFGYPQQLGPSPLQRWFQDWSNSSAGRSGTLVERHWVFQLRSGVWKGERYSEAIPRWVTRRRLPASDKAGLKGWPALREWLEAFDQKAGHPFAWYFFMLHGNRIRASAGMQVARALESGTQWLPSHDRAVLHRWALDQYGF